MSNKVRLFYNSNKKAVKIAGGVLALASALGLAHSVRKRVQHHNRAVNNAQFRSMIVHSKLQQFGKRSRRHFGKRSRGKTTIKLVSIKRSTKSGKKFMATFQTNGRTKVIHFGFSGMQDLTIHHDRRRRNRYITRHMKDLKTGDPSRAGYLSMFVLWNKPSLQASIADYRRRLNVYNRTGKFPTVIAGYRKGS